MYNFPAGWAVSGKQSMSYCWGNEDKDWQTDPQERMVQATPDPGQANEQVQGLGAH